MHGRAFGMPVGRDCLEIGVRRCRAGGQLPLLPDLGQAWGTWIFTPNQATATPQLCFSLSHSSQRHRPYPSHPLNQQGGVGMLLEGTGGGWDCRAALGTCLGQHSSRWFWDIGWHVSLELHAEKMCGLIPGHFVCVLKVCSNKTLGKKKGWSICH